MGGRSITDCVLLSNRVEVTEDDPLDLGLLSSTFTPHGHTCSMKYLKDHSRFTLLVLWVFVFYSVDIAKIFTQDQNSASLANFVQVNKEFDWCTVALRVQARPG